MNSRYSVGVAMQKNAADRDSQDLEAKQMAEAMKIRSGLSSTIGEITGAGDEISRELQERQFKEKHVKDQWAMLARLDRDNCQSLR